MRTFILMVARLVTTLIADVEIHHHERVPPSGGCIAVSNHLGRLDAVLAVVLAGRADLILIIAEKYEKSPLWRFVARHLDALFINRHEPDFRALRAVYRRLQKGEFLAIAPEGTRSQTEALIEGKPGAAYLAARANVPILPVAVTGTEDRLVLQNLRRLRRTRVVIHVGRPFTLPPLDRRHRDAHLQQYTEEIMCRIGAMLPPPYRGVYADHPRLRELLEQPA